MPTIPKLYRQQRKTIYLTWFERPLVLLASLDANLTVFANAWTSFSPLPRTDHY
jgi:hypothetical protein